MIVCSDCSVQYRSVVFHCPSCGARLVHCSAEEDTVVFRSHTAWQRVMLVRIRGKMVQDVATAAMNEEGLVIVGDKAEARLPLFELYQVLNDNEQELLEL